MQGKLAAATQVQSAEYLKPLFKLLRSRVSELHVCPCINYNNLFQSLPSDVLGRIAEIVYYMQMRQYQRANDSYLRLSIGNAPWPIGVTMVGCVKIFIFTTVSTHLMMASIHERSAREKISSDQVAHVLNDEVSRKYIQSLKRYAPAMFPVYPDNDLLYPRLLTFAQTKYPPEDVSQLMG
jgi:pre-mRNA-splicing factor 18